jgi:hypothetical protein
MRALLYFPQALLSAFARLLPKAVTPSIVGWICPIVTASCFYAVHARRFESAVALFLAREAVEMVYAAVNGGRVIRQRPQKEHELLAASEARYHHDGDVATYLHVWGHEVFSLALTAQLLLLERLPPWCAPLLAVRMALHAGVLINALREWAERDNDDYRNDATHVHLPAGVVARFGDLKRTSTAADNLSLAAAALSLASLPVAMPTAFSLDALAAMPWAVCAAVLAAVSSDMKLRAIFVMSDALKVSYPSHVMEPMPS